jgi:uncharacterized protein (DUF488 family)
MELTLYTVGHSTRSLDGFISLLRGHGVETVADVRRFPKSRKYPHFNDDSLALSLSQTGLGYVPFPPLGGRRRAGPDSPNTGWRNEGFRGYADHMQTGEFADGIARLATLAGQSPTVIMCAEAVPWRCHRSLIGDAMLVRGWRVLDITSESPPKPHKLTPFARVDGTRITYPPEVKSASSPDDRGPGLFD